MPMHDILLSGVLTGMVSSLAIVELLLHRHLQTTLELSYKNRWGGILNTEALSMLGGMSIEDLG